MDYNKVLKVVASNPVLEACRETNIEPIELMKFYNSLEKFLRKKVPYGEIGQVFIFALVFIPGWERVDTKDFNLFEGNTFVSCIKAGLFNKSNILFVNCHGDVIRQGDGQFIKDYVEAQELSDEYAVVFFVEYRAVHLVVKGRSRFYIHDILQSNRPGASTPRSLPAREYRQLIKRQYEEELKEEKGVKYWKNKEDRILRDDPEIIFHGPLWSYFVQYIPDGTPDREATVSGTANRTDIRITDFTNQARYIIEIKCLGKTLSGLEKSDEWANYGLSQINLYLNEEDRFTTRGTLVLYDGRKENKDIIWCTDIECHPNYDKDPMRFYLESESASVKAKRTVRNLKKRSRE